MVISHRSRTGLLPPRYSQSKESLAISTSVSAGCEKVIPIQRYRTEFQVGEGFGLGHAWLNSKWVTHLWFNVGEAASWQALSRSTRLHRSFKLRYSQISTRSSIGSFDSSLRCGFCGHSLYFVATFCALCCATQEPGIISFFMASSNSLTTR